MPTRRLVHDLTLPHLTLPYLNFPYHFDHSGAALSQRANKNTLPLRFFIRPVFIRVCQGSPTVPTRRRGRLEPSVILIFFFFFLSPKKSVILIIVVVVGATVDVVAVPTVRAAWPKARSEQ